MFTLLTYLLTAAICHTLKARDNVPHWFSMRDTDNECLGGLARQRPATLVNDRASNEEWYFSITPTVIEVHDCIYCSLEQQHTVNTC